MCSGDYGSRILDTLPRHLHSLYFTLRNVHVQKRTLRQGPSLRIFLTATRANRACFGEIEVITRDEAYRQARHAENSRLKGASHGFPSKWHRRQDSRRLECPKRKHPQIIFCRNL
jgi:hypothetical protein